MEQEMLKFALEETYQALLNKLERSTFQIEASFGEGYWQIIYLYL